MFMQAFIMALLVIVTTFGYLKKVGYLPAAALLLVEVSSMIALACVVGLGVQSGFRYVRPAYWIVLGAVLVCIVCGIFANSVAPGPIVMGLRDYFRPMPFFLLPAVLRFSEREVTNQLKCLAVIAVVQLPIAVDQRLENLGIGGSTGDTTQGTLLNSAILSIFLISALSVLLGLFMRGYVKARAALFLSLVLVIPTTLNETKATLFLLPLAVLVTLLVGAKPGARLKGAVVAVTCVALFLAVFVPVYDSLIESRRYGTKLGDFFSSERRTSEYLYSGAEIGDASNVRRVDAIVVPLRFLSEDPVRLVLGVGVGNASRSQFGDQFVGEYSASLGPFLFTAFSVVSTELGLLGLFLALLLHWMVFGDARIVASRGSGVVSALAMGWCGVVALVTAAYFYKGLIVYESISVLFWYFSGLVVSERMRREGGGDCHALGTR